MINPFKDLYIIPSYGKKEALIKWDVDANYLAGNFIIQKSSNGITYWDTIGSGIGLTEYKDTDFIIHNKQEQTYYRVIIQLNKQRYESNSIAVFDKLKRKEYGILHRMMQLEHYRMANVGNGIQAIILKQKYSGEPCYCVDPTTDQHVGSTLCDKCYGTGIVGGFDKPINIYMDIINHKVDVKLLPTGEGSDDIAQFKFRIIAYPELKPGDLIVNPRTDDRYVVDSVELFKFKGIVPFIYGVIALQLRRNDIRYKIPID